MTSPVTHHVHTSHDPATGMHRAVCECGWKSACYMQGRVADEFAVKHMTVVGRGLWTGTALSS